MKNQLIPFSFLVTQGEKMSGPDHAKVCYFTHFGPMCACSKRLRREGSFAPRTKNRIKTTRSHSITLNDRQEEQTELKYEIQNFNQIKKSK